MTEPVKCVHCGVRVIEVTGPSGANVWGHAPEDGPVYLLIQCALVATPAVDGEEGDAPWWWKHPLSEDADRAAVPDNLPLDPEPYALKRFVGRSVHYERRATKAPGYRFLPRPGFSRDESRYREGAGQ